MSNDIRNGHDAEKQDYRQILDGECVLVEDRWFPKGTSKRAIRKYRQELKRKEKRNARRRERRLERKLEEARVEQKVACGGRQKSREEGATWEWGKVAETAVPEVPTVRASAVAATGDSPVQRMVKDAQWQLLHRNSYDIMFGPGEVLAWVLVLDLVSILDRAVRLLWREALKLGETIEDPEILAETAILVANPKNTTEIPDFAADLENTPETTGPGGRASWRITYIPPVDTLHRLACERRKLLCRSTVAECPTPTDIRVAWHFRKASYEESIALGGLLLDLECFLDNALVRRKKDGRPCIVGRNPGIRGWLREHCPELDASYTTLIRWKNTVKRLRQSLEVPDPIPTASLLDDRTSAAELWSLPVHVQPRGDVGEELVRFPWEGGSLMLDSNGRLFATNPGYDTALGWQIDATTLERRLAEARSAVRDILAHAESAARHALSARHPRLAAIHLRREIQLCVDEREKWWRGPLAALET